MLVISSSGRDLEATLLGWFAALGGLPLLLLLLLLLGAVAIGTWRLRTAMDRWKRQRRAVCAMDGERGAAVLLADAGYAILGQQVARSWSVNVDGQTLGFRLRVDYLVERAGEVFVADAKTGELASSIGHAATRRQLLEYLLAYRAHGALLVDMQTRCIRVVRFPQL